jgi:hypothetical protein
MMENEEQERKNGIMGTEAQERKIGIKECWNGESRDKFFWLPITPLLQYSTHP